METQQISTHENLNNFLEFKKKEILEMAHQNTEELVKKENALMDFELLLSLDFSEKERERLTNESRNLREESWKELEKKFDSDTDKIQEFLNNF